MQDSDSNNLMGNRTLCEIQADFCSVFTNPVRIRIMLLLGDEEMTVGDLAAHLEISLPNLSQHLRLMKDRRCLRARKVGKNVFYRVTSPLFLQAMTLVRQGIVEAEAQRYE